MRTAILAALLSLSACGSARAAQGEWIMNDPKGVRCRWDSDLEDCAPNSEVDCSNPATDLELTVCYGATEEQMFGHAPIPAPVPDPALEPDDPGSCDEY